MTARARTLIMAVAGLSILAVLGIASWTGQDTRRTVQEQIPAQAATSAEQATPVPTWYGPTPPPVDDAMRLGKADAPVVIEEFGDFQCAECGRFARTIKPALVRKYVDTGIVRLYWRDFPASGKESEQAATAARAAARQGRFWDYHDALYARQPRRGSINDAFLRGIAQNIGLDLARFDADLRDRTLRTAVRDTFNFGQGLSVPGTPAFLIHGEPFFGAQPLKAFAKAIARARTEP